jgi:hypothetical protein
MVSSTNKFRLATVGSLICVVGVALLYKFKEEAAGKALEVPQVPARTEQGNETPKPPPQEPATASAVSTDPHRFEYHPPPMQLYPGPAFQTAATGEIK